MCASAAAQECPRRAPSPLCPRSPPRRCPTHPALRSYMRLHADPRCMRSTSSDPVLTLCTGRKVCPGYNTCSRDTAGAPILCLQRIKCRFSSGGLGGSKSGPGLNFLHRRRRLLRHHRLHRHHGQVCAPTGAGRRAAARAGCRLQLKINLPYDVHAGELDLSAKEKKPLAGPPCRPDGRQGSGFDSSWRHGGGIASLRAPAVVKLLALPSSFLTA